MPKTIADFINDLSAKAGLKADDEHLKNILSAPDLQKITIPDELVRGIDNSLLSIDQAKNNHPDIKKHYTALAFNGLDAEMNDLMDELQVPAEIKAVILNERSSTKRSALLTKKIKELEAAKKNTDDKGERTTLQNEINELRSKLVAEASKIESVKAEYEGKLADVEKKHKLRELLAGYKTVYDELPVDVRNTALESLINKTLQDKGAELKMDENGQLKLIRKDGANVFGDDNRPWNSQTLIDHTLSQNKLLKVTDPAPPPATPGNKTPVYHNDNTPADPNAPKKSSMLKNLAESSLRDMENAAKVSVM